VSDQAETTLPAVFVGHGSPMNALQRNRYTDAWAAFGAALPQQPRAILAISAHWYINASALTAMAAPNTIHDFFGFPEELFAFRYPAPGSPELAAETAEVVKPTWIGMDRDSWGIDHGTWSVLAHLYPAADIPVLQLSVDASKTPDYHVALGAALAPLRRRGVLIVASGNVVHNLPALDPARPDTGFDWAEEFDQAARTLMAEAPEDIAALSRHQRYPLAAPTPDHLLPLYYLGGLAAADGQAGRVLIDGYALGSLSMTTHAVG